MKLQVYMSFACMYEINFKNFVARGPVSIIHRICYSERLKFVIYLAFHIITSATLRLDVCCNNMLENLPKQYILF